MTVTYHQTSNMEAAVRSMKERYQTVLVLMDYKSVKPIRMRTTALLSDLGIEWSMAWKPETASAIERWRRKGGIMQYRSIPQAKRPDTPIADAILFVEAPMQWDRLEHVCMSARQAVVIYRPPTWELHSRSIDFLYPAAETYATLEAYIDALRYATPDEYLATIARVEPTMKHPVAFTGEDICEIANWDPKQLKYLLLSRYRKSIKRWHPYRVRLEPRGVEKQWAYDILKAQPSPQDGVHMLRFNEPAPRILGFMKMIKLLTRAKYLVAKPVVYVADAAAKLTDYEAVEAVNAMHRARWLKVRDFVDSLPEYQI